MPPYLEAKNISKRFAGVQALCDVSLQVNPGEVLAVVGENGAGKSTLMKILAGIIPPSTGSLQVNQKSVVLSSVHQALELGISLIHQELNLAPNLDVGANIFLGREPTHFGLIDRKTIERESIRHMARVGLTASSTCSDDSINEQKKSRQASSQVKSVSPSSRLDTIPIGKQQLVEIAKALSTNARVLIMDEPTSSLTEQEADRLLEVVQQLRDEGVAIVYISHRLHEVTKIADRVVVLRDGRYVDELVGDRINRNEIVKKMIGREVDQLFQRTPHIAGKEILKTESLRTPAFPQHPLDFSIQAGEIVALAGLVGAGRSELLTTLFGVTTAVGGDCFRSRQTGEAELCCRCD